MAAPVLPLLLGAGAVALAFFASGDASAKEPQATGPKPKGKVWATQAVSAELPTPLALELAKAIDLLNVDPATGEITKPATTTAVQYATEVAGKVERAGCAHCGAAAMQLRQWAQEAAQTIPSDPPEQQVPMPPDFPPELREQIDRIIKLERDPQKLAQVIAALEQMPQSPERDNAIAMLQALILQIQSKQVTDQALQEVDQVMKQPSAPKPAPAPTKVTVPSTPKPQDLPPPKSQQEVDAESMVQHLWRAQSKYGLKAKGKENKGLVKRFQQSAGLKADGLAGPQTLLSTVQYGQSKLPLVMYWPRGAPIEVLEKYKSILSNVANTVRSKNPEKAAELAASAEREKGQYGSFSSVQPQPQPVTTTSQPTLRRGSRGTAVQALQTALGITADGIFGPDTERAVKTFQQSRGLKVDGIVGPNTWAALAASPPAAATTVAPALPPAPAPAPAPVRPTIRRGSRGVHVQALQRALNITADGIFGPGTERAVKQYQSANGLTVDGIVGPQTWGSLGE